MTETEKAALDSVDRDRLLEGEDPSSTYVEDAHHWLQVYSELLDYKTDLLSSTHQKLDQMGEGARLEVQRTDLRVIESEAARFQRRYLYWKARHEELSA